MPTPKTPKKTAAKTTDTTPADAGDTVITPARAGQTVDPADVTNVPVPGGTAPAESADAGDATVTMRALVHVPASMFGGNAEGGNRADMGTTFKATEAQATELERVQYAERVEETEDDDKSE